MEHRYVLFRQSSGKNLRRNFVKTKETPDLNELIDYVNKYKLKNYRIVLFEIRPDGSMVHIKDVKI